MDNLDRVVLVNAKQQIQIYEVQNYQFLPAQTYDLSEQINDPNDNQFNLS